MDCGGWDLRALGSCGAEGEQRNSRMDETGHRTAIEIKKESTTGRLPEIEMEHRLEHEFDCEIHAPWAALGNHRVAD